MKNTFMLIIFVLLLMWCSVHSEETSELDYALKLYEKGDTAKAESILELLKKDSDRKLAEEAFFNWLILFSDTFVPADRESMDLHKKMTAFNSDYQDFKEKYPDSPYLKKLDSLLASNTKKFNKLTEDNSGDPALFLRDTLSYEIKEDSTYSCEINTDYTKKDGSSGKFKIVLNGKLKYYDPYADMKDEWGSKGLVLKTDETLEFFLGDEKVRQINRDIDIKQYPEYVLRKVTKYGFSQEQTFIREDPVKNLLQAGTTLNDEMIIPWSEFCITYGTMDRLVPYNSDDENKGIKEIFKPELIVNLTILNSK